MLLANRLRMVGGGGFGEFIESGQAGYRIFSAAYSSAYDKIYIHTDYIYPTYSYMFVGVDNIGDTLTAGAPTNALCRSVVVDGNRLVYKYTTSIYTRSILSNGTLEQSETRIETGMASTNYNGFAYGDYYVTPRGAVVYNSTYNPVNLYSFSGRYEQTRNLYNFHNDNNSTQYRYLYAACVTEGGSVWVAYKYAGDTLVYIAEVDISSLPTSLEFTGRYFTATVATTFIPQTLIHKDKEFIIIDSSLQGNYQKFTGDV